MELKYFLPTVAPSTVKDISKLSMLVQWVHEVIFDFKLKYIYRYNMSFTTERVSIDISTGIESGQITGPWADAQFIGKRYEVRSIGYPIIAASVSPLLETDTFIVTVDGVTNTITLPISLPGVDTLVASINLCIRDEFGLDAPQLIKLCNGWNWVNNAATTASVQYTSTNSQILQLGRIFGKFGYTINFTAGEVVGPFYPDSRLGAYSQTLHIVPNNYKIDLPVLGEYLESVMFAPDDEKILFDRPATSGYISCLFASIPSEVTLKIDKTAYVNLIVHG